MPQTTDQRIGTVLDGRYRILKRLAKGSSGVVYMAQRIQLERAVAIKFLDFTAAMHPAFRKLFEVEAKAMGQLSHPNCISVIDFGVSSSPYIVMELVRGHTLKSLIEKGPTDPYRAIHIVRQLLAALAHAHKKGIIHRDIKPGNIMLSEVTGAGDFVRVFDFGLAKLLDKNHNAVDDPDLVAGTPHYMSPEHISHQELDARADLFSTAVVLYELLTGCKPFKIKNTTEILHIHDHKPLLLQHALIEKYFSKELEDLVSKALSLNPSDRFQTAMEFSTALQSVPEVTQESQSLLAPSEEDKEITPLEPFTVPPKRTRRGYKLLGGTVIILVSLLALDLYLWFNKRPFNEAGIVVSPIDTLPEAPKLGMGEGTPIVSNLSEPEMEDTDDGMGGDPMVSAKADLVDEEIFRASDEVTKYLDKESANTLALVQPLVISDELDQALAVVENLQKKYPNHAYLCLLRGNLHGKRKQWVQAIEYYKKAIHYNSEYKHDKMLIEYSILALSDDRAYPDAKLLVEREIGTQALPRLLQLVEKESRPYVRNRVQAIIETLYSR